MKNKNFTTKRQGSILVFSLFIMMISLIIGISLMTTSSVGRKSTLSSAKSTNAFQVADSGIEYAYWKIRKYRWDSGKDLQDDNVDIVDAVFSNCDSDDYSVSGTANGGNYKLFFTDSSDNPIHCNGGNGRLVNIKKIKSVGEYNGIKRSVEISADFSGL